MRPFGLLLAACVCTVLPYDRLAGRFLDVLLAAASAPTIAPQTSVRPETRLEKLQHYEVLLRLRAVEDAKLDGAEKFWRFLRDNAADELFKTRLDKKLRPTWERMKSFSDYDKWKDSLAADKKDEMVDEEDKRTKLLKEQWEPFRRATQKFDSEIAKAVDKKIENEPGTKTYLGQKAFVEMLEHERDAAREALKQK
jgi:hypothetical protein